KSASRRTLLLVRTDGINWGSFGAASAIGFELHTGGFVAARFRSCRKARNSSARSASCRHETETLPAREYENSPNDFQPAVVASADAKAPRPALFRFGAFGL